MRWFFTLLFFFSLQQVLSQQLIRKSLISSRTNTIRIDAAACYAVQLSTAPGRELTVDASVEGEHRRQVMLRIREEGNTAVVDAVLNPLFDKPGDKLSAHKVLSIILNIQVPEHLAVSVYGDGAHTTATGNYRLLEVVLANGNILLSGFSGNAEMRTSGGNIRVNTSAATIDAQTKYGKIQRDSIPEGNDLLDLSTISGNISLNKT